MRISRKEVLTSHQIEIMKTREEDQDRQKVYATEIDTSMKLLIEGIIWIIMIIVSRTVRIINLIHSNEWKPGYL